jgi:hypothetical protein
MQRSPDGVAEEYFSGQVFLAIRIAVTPNQIALNNKNRYSKRKLG